MRTCLVAVIAAVLGGGCSRAPAPAPAVAPPAAESALQPDRRAESPSYARWAKFPVGTSVTVADQTEVPGGSTAGTNTYKLTALTPATATVAVTSSGHLTDDSSELKYPRWMAKPEGKAAEFAGAPVGSYEVADETITVRGSSYKCRRYKARGSVEAGPTETVTWLCDEVPGGLVKSVHRIPSIKKSVTSELVSVTKP